MVSFFSWKVSCQGREIQMSIETPALASSFDDLPVPTLPKEPGSWYRCCLQFGLVVSGCVELAAAFVCASHQRKGPDANVRVRSHALSHHYGSAPRALSSLAVETTISLCSRR